MPDQGSVTYRSFEQNLLLRNAKALFDGIEGKALAVLAVTGLGVFGVVFDAWGFGLGLAGTLALLGGGWVWMNWRNPKIQKPLIREVLENNFEVADIEDSALQRELSEGFNHVVKIAEVAAEISRKKGRDADLEHMFANTASMLELQIDSAHRVERLEKVLDSIASLPSRRGGETQALLEENIAALKREVKSEREVVEEITHKLRVFVLQVSQMDKRTSDIVNSTKFAEESREMLGKLQAVVDARRETAEEIIGRITPQRLSL